MVDRIARDTERIARDTVRMTMRAFYADNEIVIVDAILRERNYTTEEDLVRKLHLPTKDVRAVLKQMKAISLLCSQRREFQTPVSEHSTKTRKVTNEYWYVEYRDFIDILKYKVHKIRKKIEDQVSEMAAQQQQWHCPRCGAVYPTLGIEELLDPMSGAFLCTRPINRKQLCRGALEEEDVAGGKRELENLLDRFEKQMRPMQEKLAQLDQLEIPLQSEPDMDMQQRTVATGGTERSARSQPTVLNGNVDVILEVGDDGDHTELNEGRDDGVAARPVWFEGAPTINVEAGDDDAAAEEPAQNDVVMNGLTLYDSSANAGAETAAAEVDADAPAAAEEGAAEAEPAAAEEPAAVQTVTDEPLIAVGDDLIPISQITDEQSGRMSMEQYEAYAVKFQEYYHGT